MYIKTIILNTSLQTQVHFAAKIQEQRKRQTVNISIDRRNVIDSKHVEPLDALSGAGPHLLWRLQKLDKRKCGHLSSSLISKVLRNYITVQELDHVMKNLGDDVNYIALVSSIASDIDDETESLNVVQDDKKMSEYVVENHDDDVKSSSYAREDVKKSFSYEEEALEDVKKSFSYEKKTLEREEVKKSFPYEKKTLEREDVKKSFPYEKKVEAFPPHFQEDELEDDEEEELDLPPSTDVVPPPPPPPSTRPPKHQLNRVRDRRKQIDEMQQQLRTRSTPMSRKSYSVKKDMNNTGRRHRPQQVKNRRVPSTVSAGDRRKQYLKRRNKMNRTTIKKKNSTLNNRKRKVKSDMRTPPPPPSSTVSKSGSRSSNTKTRRPRKVVVEDKTDSAIRSYITRRMRQVSRG